MRATEGWPLGVALAAGMVRPDAGLTSLGSAPDLRSYLSEELFDSLAPELREAAVRSSVVRVITPEVVRSLDLPHDLGDRVERAGILLHRPADFATMWPRAIHAPQALRCWEPA